MQERMETGDGESRRDPCGDRISAGSSAWVAQQISKKSEAGQRVAQGMAPCCPAPDSGSQGSFQKRSAGSPLWRRAGVFLGASPSGGGSGRFLAAWPCDPLQPWRLLHRDPPSPPLFVWKQQGLWPRPQPQEPRKGRHSSKECVSILSPAILSVPFWCRPHPASPVPLPKAGRSQSLRTWEGQRQGRPQTHGSPAL